MRRRVRGVLIILMMAVAAACGGGGGGASGDGDGDDIAIALEAEPRTLDPQITQDGQMRRVAENLFERLVDRDLDDPSELVPRLAAELPERIDETTWEVKLREGVTFHNDEPFNAESAAWSINREIDPEYDSELLSQILTITGAEVVDEHTIHILTDGPDPVLPARLYMIPQVPLEYSKDDAFARKPVGTGPYEFVEWAAGDHIDIARYDDYWGDAPQIESARFRFLPENQSRVASLQSGEVDLAMGIAPESTGEVPQLITRDGLEFPYIRLKNYEGPFQDERVRKAVAHAINVPEYIETIYADNATEAQCQTNGEAVFGFNPDLEPYPHDPERAEELLAEAGYDGEPARIIAPTGRWQKFEELAEAIESDLKAVGLNVTIEMIQFDPWLTEFIQHPDEGQPDGAISSTTNELLDGDRLSSLFGEQGSVSSYIDPEISNSLAEARSELDVDTREQMYQDLADTLCEDVANVGMLNFKDIYGATENLEWTPRIDGTARVDEMTLN